MGSHLPVAEAHPGRLRSDLSSFPEDGGIPDALIRDMNTQTLGIPLTGRRSDDHLIPTQRTIVLPLIRRLAAAHAAVLEDWNRKFALDLRWHGVASARR
jgi:hypothetical protein